MKYILIILTLMISSEAIAQNLEKGNKYRLKTEISVKEDKENDDSKNVGAESKFEIISLDEEKEFYAVKFTNVYKEPYLQESSCPKECPWYKFQCDEIEESIRTCVGFKPYEIVRNKTYFIAAKDSQGVPIEDKVEKSDGGVTSGPLIVPFKYRLNDKSVSGEATLGYYAGYGFDFKGLTWFDLTTLDRYVVLVPFISAGLTQVSVASTEEDGSIKEDNKTGATIAVGAFVKNWDKVNIGIIWGQDRIGNKEWTHEGETWFSLSVGWKL